MLGSGPLTPRRAAAWLAVAAAAGLSLWQLPGVFERTGEAADAVAGLTAEQRRLLPARAADIETSLFARANEVIPPTATYHVITGDGFPIAVPNTIPKMPVFAGFYLLPRRLTYDAAKAEWIVSYGGDLDSLGLRYAQVIEVMPGLQLAEVAR